MLKITNSVSFLATLLITVQFGAILQFRREAHFQKEMAKMNYDYFLAAVKERDDKTDKLVECEAANYDLTQKDQMIDSRDQEMASRWVKVWKRFAATTDLLEGVSRCYYFKLPPEDCVGNTDLGEFIDSNRKETF